jgi:tetratricopeptide (TPR) repeat protein
MEVFMQPVTNVLAITLSVLTSLSQWFGEGMQAVKQEKYEAAAAAFTRVIEAEAPVNPLKETALYWRAHSFAALKQNEKAAKDIETLINANPGSSLLPLAVKTYKELTGKDWAGLNLTTPRDTWRSFLAAMRARDVDQLRRCCTGEWLRELGWELECNLDFLDDLGDLFVTTRILEVRSNAAGNRACLVLAEEDSSSALLLLRLDGGWIIAGEQDLEDFEGDDVVSDVPAQQGWINDVSRLRQLAAAMEQYTLAKNAPPARLEDIREYLKNFAAASTSAVNGKAWALAMPKGPDDKEKTTWIFMSSPSNGRRQGVFDGEVRTISEGEFQQLCRERGVKVAPVIQPVALSAEEEKQIRQLISRLGAREFKERQAAYDDLKKLGMKAGNLLEEAQKDPDPEVALQAGKLLSELTSKE